VNYRLVALLSVCILALIPLALSESSEGATLPACDESFEVVNKTYYTNSPVDSFWLTDLSGGNYYATLIWGSYGQGNCTIDRSGAPAWITFDIFSSRADVKITITPGAVCDDTFWIMFKCFGSDKILLTFKIRVLDSGHGVIPAENLKTFVLKFDTAGGSRIGDMSAQSTTTSHTFNLDNVQKPTRDGYKFLGWSSDDSGLSMLMSPSYPMSITDGSNYITKTLYALWEKEDRHIIIPTIWDDLFALLTEPMVIIGLVVMMLSSAVFIRSRGG